MSLTSSFCGSCPHAPFSGPPVRAGALLVDLVAEDEERDVLQVFLGAGRSVVWRVAVVLAATNEPIFREKREGERERERD